MSEKFTSILIVSLMPMLALAQQSRPAPVNEYKGIQEREEVYAFTEKPKVEKQGGKWIITFASKAACDATVSILDKDGKIIRHLASGVLGVNAPHPFQQNSLSQKIEWDGLADDFASVETAGCTVRVSLGLKAEYDRDLAWAPARTTYIEKEGKYFRTVFPPPAETPPELMGQLTSRLATTTWGEKIPVGGWFSPFCAQHGTLSEADIRKVVAKVEPLFADKTPPRKLDFRPTQTPTAFHGPPRITVDPVTEDVYWMTPGGTAGGYVLRYSGKTGRFDSEFNKGEKGLRKGPWCNISEMDFGPDGLIYMTCGAFHSSWYMFRVDRDWKAVPFTDKAETHAVKLQGSGELSIKGVLERAGYWNVGPAAMLDPKYGLTELIWTGGVGGSNVHDPGFDVSLSGHIVVMPQQRRADWVARHKAPSQDNCLQVWSTDGTLLSADAVGVAVWGHGVRMDRDGNLYIVAGGVLPPGQDRLWGIADVKAAYRVFGGHASLLKFRGQGKGRFALDEGQPIKVGEREVKSLWAFGGVSNQSSGDCSCQHSRYDLDAYARSWIPARHLCSVVVLDANGNCIARFGRYGNVDDADPTCGGIHLVNPRGVTVSETGLYILDSDQKRLLKAELSYATEASVPVE